MQSRSRQLQQHTGLICACPCDWQELRRREEVARGQVRVVFRYQCTLCLPLADEVELEVPEAVEWWPRYDAYLRPVEQATPRMARRWATTSPHGKMVPMDLIDEESGL